MLYRKYSRPQNLGGKQVGVGGGKNNMICIDNLKVLSLARRDKAILSESTDGCAIYTNECLWDRSSPSLM